jgi:antiviral helicase SKI2
MPLPAKENGDASLDRFLELLQAAGAPSSSTLSADALAAELGINGLPTPEEAVKLVETNVLSPAKDLSGPDLWRWQVPLPTPVPLPQLRLEPLPGTHTVAPTFRGIDGTFTHWRDSLAPKPAAHPSLSSSMMREPGKLSSFVRGKSTNAPFLPGGLEPAVAVEEEEELEEEDGWKTRAPGLRRGVPLDGGGCESCAHTDPRSGRVPVGDARVAVHGDEGEEETPRRRRVSNP